MTITNAINNQQAVEINIVTFTSSGVYTPPQNLLYAQIECVGGGGGSGAVQLTLSNQCASAPGGGGGGYSMTIANRATLAPSTTITVGSGGAGGTWGISPTNGSAGGTSIVGALCQATGGAGSLTANSSTANEIGGAAGGVGSGGIINSLGAGGQFAVAVYTLGQSSGAGGPSRFGGNGRARSNTRIAGIAGTNGGGGGGPSNRDFFNGLNGALGGDGIVIITEYLAQ